MGTMTARKKHKRTPTLEERAQRVANQSLYESYWPKREERVRAMCLRELRAAVRAAYKECAEECDELYAIAIVREQHPEGREPVKASAAIDECASRIRARRKP